MHDGFHFYARIVILERKAGSNIHQRENIDSSVTSDYAILVKGIQRKPNTGRSKIQRR